MQTYPLSDDLRLEFSAREFSAHSPALYFAGMSELLDAMQSLDANLIAFVLPNARAIQRIEQVTTGSIRLKIASFIEYVPDEVLKTGDWKRVCGHFLVEGRKKILLWLHKQPKVIEKAQVEDLANELDRLATESTGPTRRISRRLLLSMIIRVIRGTQAMPGKESVTVRMADTEVVLPREVEVPAETANAVAESELEPFEQEMRLLVKKPDMIGKSQWDFLDRGHVIRAKMSDGDWVENYQNNQLSLKPGDAIEAKVRLTPKHGTDDHAYNYDVLQVRSVVPSTVTQQALLFDESA
jgi:hypothetical protein